MSRQHFATTTTTTTTTSSGGGASTTFTPFRVPGSRFQSSPTTTNSTTVSVSSHDGPQHQQPQPQPPQLSIDLQQRASYTSTLPASPVFSRDESIDFSGAYEGQLGTGGLEPAFEDDDDAAAGVAWMRTGRVVRVKETGRSYRFPLDPEHLPRVGLSTDSARKLEQRLGELLDRAVHQHSVSWMENPTMAPVNAKYQWKVHHEKKQCVLYRRRNDPTLSRHYLLRAKLDASLPQVMYGLLHSQTEDERAVLAHLHRDDFLDGAVLQVLPTELGGDGSDAPDPYRRLAIKWLALQSSVDSMYGIRDVLYAEYTRTVVDAKGQRVVVRVQQSIKARDYGIVERDFGFSRNEIACIQLFRVLPGSNDTKVDLSMSGSITFPTSANTPSWLVNRFLQAVHSVATNMAVAGDAKHIAKHGLITEKPWVPNSERSACSVCLKSFNLLRSRHHCRICAEIMCTTCTLELAIRTSSLPPMLRPEGALVSAEKFCYRCIEKGRNSREDTSQEHLVVTAPLPVLDTISSMDSDDKENYIADRLSERPRSSGGSSFSSTRSKKSNNISDISRVAFMSMAAMTPTALVRTQSASSAAEAQANVPKGGNGNWSKKVLSAMGKDPAPRASNASSVSSEDSTSHRLHPRRGSFPQRHNTVNAEPYQQEEPRDGGYTRPPPSGRLPTTSLSGESTTSRDSEDVISITPMPGTFAKMEESIAAQQQLLRNMMLEGQKMMQQQQYYQGYGATSRRMEPSHPPRPALPPPEEIL